MLTDLKALADATLIDCLPKRLKQSIDSLLAAGETPEEILAWLRETCGLRRTRHLTMLAVEAYLKRPQEG